MGLAEQFKAQFVERDLPVIGKVLIKEVGPDELEGLPEDAKTYDIIAATVYEQAEDGTRKLAFGSVSQVRALKWGALQHLVKEVNAINGLGEDAEKNSPAPGSSETS
jgi:hypothetical protein